MSSDAAPIVSPAMAIRALVRGAATAGLAGVCVVAVGASWQVTLVALIFGPAAAASATAVERLAATRGRGPGASAALAASGCLAVYLVAAVNAGWCLAGPTRGLEALTNLLRRGPGKSGAELMAGVGLVSLYLAGAHALNALAERTRGAAARPVVDGAAMRAHLPVVRALGLVNLGLSHGLGLIAALETLPTPTEVARAMGMWLACTATIFAIGAALVLGLHVVCLYLDRWAWRPSPPESPG